MMESRYTLAQLAQRFSLEYKGNPDFVISGVQSLLKASSNDLSFISEKKYLPDLLKTNAGIVVVSSVFLNFVGGNVLISDKPYVDYAKIAALFDYQEPIVYGIHATAIVSETAKISPKAQVGPYCVIGDNTIIEEAVVIGPHCIIGRDCLIDVGSTLLPRVTLVKNVHLGKRVLVHPGAVIGGDGFRLLMHEGKWVKVPQLGKAIIGDDCEIGVNTTIDRGGLDDTVLESDVRLDNLVHIGHNVLVGSRTAMAAFVGIGGGSFIGKNCLLGGKVGVSDHITLADNVALSAGSNAGQSISSSGHYASGWSAQKNISWLRILSCVRKIDNLFKRVADLEKIKDTVE